MSDGVAALQQKSRPQAFGGHPGFLSGGVFAPRSPQFVVVAVSIWLAAVGNWRLWQALNDLGSGTGTVVVMTAVLVSAIAVLLSFGAWPRVVKPYLVVMIAIAAMAQHFMLAYRVVVDPTMLTNVIQTDVREARDLMSLRLLENVLIVAAVPLFWLARVRIVGAGRWRGEALRNLVLMGVALAVLLVAVFAGFRQLAPLMRNNPQLRYMMNPLASVYSLARQVKKPSSGPKALIPITGGVALGATYAAQAKPPLFVLVVGETARADHFALNGYDRDTTPQLKQRDVLSWRNVHSCGTSTAASVPCMFSHLGKTAFEGRKAEYETLMDVLQASGLAVLWIDNQSGCKGVCDRVPHVSTCDGDDCLDAAMLEGIDQRIAELPAERRQRGVVLVMHQMGSHGPAYFKRSAPDMKRFMPECKTVDLPQCNQAELINGFDNSIAETDRFLSRTIDWLKKQSATSETAMLYMSDHGESLGEFGIYLHGMPYGFAPESQKHVPMVMWPGTLVDRTRVSTECLGKRLDAPLTHDNMYSTVLGILDVKSPTYKPALDALASCRS